MQVGLNIGGGYQDYAGKALELNLISGVIQVRFKHVHECQGNAC
jgi:hypothetical protein